MRVREPQEPKIKRAGLHQETGPSFHRADFYYCGFALLTFCAVMLFRCPGFA